MRFASVAAFGALLFLSGVVNAQAPQGSYRTGMISVEAITDELQVAWTIPPLALEPQTITLPRRRIIYQSPVLPQRLFVARQPVLGADGATLAPAGTQFLLMEWSSFAVCSLGRDQPGLAGATRKLCLLDEDGDGAPDTSFRGSGDYDGWYVLNRQLPAERARMRPVTLTEIPPADLVRKPVFTLRIDEWPSERRGFLLSGNIDGANYYWTGCLRFEARTDSACITPPVIIRSYTRSPGGQDSVTISGLGQPAKLRFRINYGMIAGGTVTGVRVFYDDEALRALGR